jgi:hypothetical protein
MVPVWQRMANNYVFRHRPRPWKRVSLIDLSFLLRPTCPDDVSPFYVQMSQKKAGIGSLHLRIEPLRLRLKKAGCVVQVRV